MSPRGLLGASLSALRFEYKYRIEVGEYLRVRNAVRRIARHDAYTLNAPRSRYLVRSLYFDTSDYQAYADKIIGLPNRIKLRIRTYWQTPAEARLAKLEIKTRHGVLVGKHVQVVSVEDGASILDRRGRADVGGPVATEFLRLALLRDLKPKLLVDYDREAFVPLDGSDVRITFDHDVRFAAATHLFPTRTFFRKARPWRVIMEIKTRDARPAWLDRLVRTYGLTSLPNSKYAWGIQQTQNALTW